ncbi:MAG: hypothetical protein WBQ25_12170 [Nitrososphaeraceae archaeon]
MNTKLKLKLAVYFNLVISVVIAGHVFIRSFNPCIQWRNLQGIAIEKRKMIDTLFVNTQSALPFPLFFIHSVYHALEIYSSNSHPRPRQTHVHLKVVYMLICEILEK